MLITSHHKFDIANIHKIEFSFKKSRCPTYTGVFLSFNALYKLAHALTDD